MWSGLIDKFYDVRLIRWWGRVRTIHPDRTAFRMTCSSRIRVAMKR